MANTNLAPGLYDENDNLLASWSTLVNTHGLDIEKDYVEDDEAWDSWESLHRILYNSEFENGKKFVIADSVTHIGAYAFLSCESLTSIIIPDSVISIGRDAFRFCRGLTSIVVPDSVTSMGDSVFDYCEALTSAVLPRNLTIIENGLFFNCHELESVNIPDTVTDIGNQSFQHCSSLTSITLPNGVKRIGRLAFYEAGIQTINIPSSVTVIDERAFGYSKLTSITIPDSVASMVGRTFQYCRELVTAVIGNGITRIEMGAFDFCSKLTTVSLGNKVEYIGSCAFQGCTALTSLNIPSSVKVVVNLFGSYDVSGLSYNIYDNAKYLGNDSNPYLVLVTTISKNITSCDIHSNTKIINGDAFYNCKSLTSITIPEGITCIGSYTFWNCTALVDVSIPSSVSFVGGSIAHGCNNLRYELYDNAKYLGNDENKNLVLVGMVDKSAGVCTVREGTKIISESAFWGSSLRAIAIPSSVTYISDSVFSSCYSLRNVYYDGTEEEWNAINIESSGNDYLLSATVNYFTPDAVVNYGGSVLAEVRDGNTITVNCAGKMMNSNLDMLIFKKTLKKFDGKVVIK